MVMMGMIKNNTITIEETATQNVDAEHSRKNKNCGVLIFESVRVGHED
jgi:hypothetical protein